MLKCVAVITYVVVVIIGIAQKTVFLGKYE
jgi:hypothetical protein